MHALLQATALTERYCLYSAAPNGQLFRGDIHHLPWPLQRAEAEIRVNTMTAQLGLKLPDAEPLLHFASGLEVLAWQPVANPPNRGAAR